MKLSDFTVEPAGVDERTLKRRLVIVVTSSVSAYLLFFGVAWILSPIERAELPWLGSVPFVGFLPALYAWIMGWVARWKVLVFAFLIPVGIWIAGVIALSFVVELWGWAK